jgi:hypothetical protein
MSDASKQRLKISARGAVVLVAALLALSPSPAAGQGYCAQHTKTLLDTADNCVNEPWRPRASSTQTFRWKGHDYLIFNTGNELSIYQVDNPTNPVAVDESNFDFDTRGDSDYDILTFDVCDDCRYGVLGHKVQRTVVFDLGIGSAPNFGGFATYNANESTAGGFVFSKGGQQYLIATDLPGGCTQAGLYMVNGVASSTSSSVSRLAERPSRFRACTPSPTIPGCSICTSPCAPARSTCSVPTGAARA